MALRVQSPPTQTMKSGDFYLAVANVGENVGNCELDDIDNTQPQTNQSETRQI